MYTRGRLDEAIDACNRAIALEPAHAGAHANLGNALKDKGRLDEAIVAFKRAIELQPDRAEGHNNLGNSLMAQGRLDEAIDACNRAIALRPDLAEAHINLGNALMSLGKLDEAIAAFRRAIALRPDLAEAHMNLSNALLSARRLDEAIDASLRAIALRPDLAEAHNNLATVWQETGRPDEAIAAYRTAIALKPDYAVAYNNLGTVLKEQGRLDDALASFRRALELNPDGSQAASNLVYSLHFHPDYDAQAILEEHRRQVRQLVEPLAVNIRPHPNDRTPDRRLRIGFLSPDLRDHPVGQSLLPLFLHHDRRQLAFVAYSDVRVSDRVTAQLIALADRWHDTLPLSDERLADRIRADRIDILVDLTLHTAHNRLLVLARNPAPIQLTMLGPPTTTGLEAIDYRLTDRFLDPPGESDGDYTEHSIRLPHCFWCYQPPEEAPPVGELPARKKGVVTFGCLNQFAKVSRPVLQLWINILQSLPASRLVLQAQPGSHLEPIRRLFQDGGIALDRVEFAARVPRLQYLQRYHDLDLCLDPFPFSGHTSTLDALWMGVPVIALAGRTSVGRAGVSLLSNVGLPELIAHTPQQYVDIAVRWAGDLPRLAALAAGCGSGCRLPSCSTGDSSPPTSKPHFDRSGRPGVDDDANHDRAGDHLGARRTGARGNWQRRRRPVFAARWN